MNKTLGLALAIALAGTGCATLEPRLPEAQPQMQVGSERLGRGMVDEARFTESIRRHASALKLPQVPATERLFTARFLPPAAALARIRQTQGAVA